ncbi:Protein of unknown function [Cotesia congregata]|uniref:Uncharacterized protein n=1 Tax=Cotesia congregata TaxID=51543 RepID=A0A8J2MQH3_COTCN|nr:Protein of unknown function [Cotesia congregata]
MTRILQGNLNRCALAQNLLRQRVFEDKIDVCFICEQYLNIEGKTWFADETGTAAIWIVNTKNVTVNNSGSGAGFVWIQTPTTYFMSVYLSPNEGISVVGLAFAPVSQCDVSKRKWNAKRLDPEALKASLARSWSILQNNTTPDTCSETEKAVLNTMKEIAAACDASMPWLKNQRFHRPAYWWSADIAELRKICHQLRRRATRAAKRSPSQDEHSKDLPNIRQNSLF